MCYIKTRRQAESQNQEDEIEINKKHQLFLDIAAETAKFSTMQQKHGAVVVHKNKVIACGFNYTTHFLNDNNSIHAEVAAITQVLKNKNILNECDIYVVRIAPQRFNNCLKMSKPCDKCTRFIKKYNIRKTYYSTNYEYDYNYLNI
jgi:deoxycytidylate deaminase